MMACHPKNFTRWRFTECQIHGEIKTETKSFDGKKTFHSVWKFDRVTFILPFIVPKIISWRTQPQDHDDFLQFNRDKKCFSAVLLKIFASSTSEHKPNPASSIILDKTVETISSNFYLFWISLPFAQPPSPLRYWMLLCLENDFTGLLEQRNNIKEGGAGNVGLWAPKIGYGKLYCHFSTCLNRFCRRL